MAFFSNDYKDDEFASNIMTGDVFGKL